MNFKHAIVEEDGGVATVRLHRPEARNALSLAMMSELTQIARLYRARADVCAIILTGGVDYFSAGADLKLNFNHEDSHDNASLMALREVAHVGPQMCKAWEEIESVTIAAIEGFCVGGACALALTCDFRIIGQSGSMRLPEVSLGLSMSWQTLPRLTSMIGPPRAKRFVMFGEALDAATSHEWGMVDEIAATGQAYATARKWTTKIASLPPIPVRMTKEAVNASSNANHHATSYMERDQFILTMNSQDFRDGRRAFIEKHPPESKHE